MCVQWDPFFDRFPPGLYLCQRCLRSRRPCIEEVEATCSIPFLPDNSLEKVFIIIFYLNKIFFQLLVQNLINNSVKIFTNLHNQLHFIPKGVDLNTIDIETKKENQVIFTAVKT